MQTRPRPSRRPVKAALGALTLSAALVLSACGSTEQAVEGGGGVSGALSQIEGENRYTPAATPLVSTVGGEQALGDVDADVTLVFFGYTHCPDICGTIMSTIATALRQLEPADRERVDVTFVTTDPARDDQQTLRTYLDRYDPEFVGLTGSLDDILAVGTSMAVHIEEGEPLPSGGYEVVHTDHVLGLDDEGRGSYVWGRQTSAAELRGDLELLLADA
ncbi:SCO family protein [Nocardioides yefusunii]|uniref:SCO family protein n=1 Tax=Nocardioides yefusunii TaxID=2500546 RepID=A0ABW1QVE8_9ACTN|nr:SCO family protein [Nocardioides yefusunii]